MYGPVPQCTAQVLRQSLDLLARDAIVLAVNDCAKLSVLFVEGEHWIVSNPTDYRRHSFSSIYSVESDCV